MRDQKGSIHHLAHTRKELQDLEEEVVQPHLDLHGFLLG